MIRAQRPSSTDTRPAPDTPSAKWVLFAAILGVLLGALARPVFGGDLKPGAGFTTPVPTFAAIGEGEHANAPTSVRWVESAYIDQDGRVTLGVLADHPAGVKAIAVSLNGGPWSVQTPRPFQDAGQLVGVRFEPGALGVMPAMLRAVAVPHAGVPATAELALPVDPQPRAIEPGNVALTQLRSAGLPIPAAAAIENVPTPEADDAWATSPFNGEASDASTGGRGGGQVTAASGGGGGGGGGGGAASFGGGSGGGGGGGGGGGAADAPQAPAEASDTLADASPPSRFGGGGIGGGGTPDVDATPDTPVIPDTPGIDSAPDLPAEPDGAPGTVPGTTPGTTPGIASPEPDASEAPDLGNVEPQPEPEPAPDPQTPPSNVAVPPPAPPSPPALPALPSEPAPPTPAPIDAPTPPTADPAPTEPIAPQQPPADEPETETAENPPAIDDLPEPGGVIDGGGGGPDDAPKLKPGNGFPNQTPELAAVGDPLHAAYDTTAIALWDVVPMQEVTEPFEVGVVAAHIHGIDRVELILDGGSPIVLRDESKNPRTGEKEYWAVFDPSKVSDGIVTLRAIAYPNVGSPRAVDLRLIANSNDSLFTGEVTVGDGGAFPTLLEAVEAVKEEIGSAEGVTFRLMPGRHDNAGIWALPDAGADRRWVTITGPEPGNGTATIEVRDGYGLAGHLRFRHVTLDLIDGADLDTAGKFRANPWRIWFDEGSFVYGDPDRPFQGYLARGDFSGGQWFTGARVQGVHKGFTANIVRDSVGQDIAEDAFHNPVLVLSTKIERVDRKGTNMHPDVFYWNNRPTDNVFIRDVDVTEADSQGLMLTGTMRNIAIHNVDITEHTGGGARVFRAYGKLSHVYIKNGRYDGPSEFREPDVSNFVIQGAVFGSNAPFLPKGMPSEGVILRGYPFGD
ncbi:MAG: hypothetical protein AAGB29_05020 [Planctomycetota bacterium]